MANPESRPMEKTSVPCVYKRGNRYVAIPRIDGKQRKIACRTLAEGRDIMALSRTNPKKLKKRLETKATGLTVREYGERWIVSYTGRSSRGFRESTRDDYRRELAYNVYPLLGETLIRKLKPEDIRGLVIALGARGLAPASIRNALAPLKAMLGTAVDDKVIKHNPCTGVRVAGAQRQQAPQVLSDDEVDALIDGTSEFARPALLFLAGMGVRVSELLGLRWQNVNLDERTVRIVERRIAGSVDVTKSEAGDRTLPLPAPVVTALKEQAEAFPGGPNDLVFRNPDGAPLDYYLLLKKVIKPAARAIGAGWVGTKTLRHTCATRMLRRGATMAQVSWCLGHSQSSFTLRTYIHVTKVDIPDPDAMF